MRFIHLSDLHIGKRVHEVSMIDDQKYIFAQILDIIQEEKVDGVFIAGDIYDKSMPSAESVALFDYFLNELVARNVMIFMIYGNHDCPERVAFASEIMNKNNVFISPVYEGKVKKVSLTDDYGQIDVFLLPFLKPSTVRNALNKLGEEVKIDTYNDALKTAIDRIKIDPTHRNIILSHQFVVGAKSCDSEEISVGGIEQVGAEVYKDFDYVALGHIHTPQTIKSEYIRYCGTPLKYSFSEANQEKSVTIIDFYEKGKIDIKLVKLKARIDMREIKGSYEEVTHLASKTDTRKINDYVSIKLTDEEDIIDGIYKLRGFYPNIMLLSYDNLRSKVKQDIKVLEDIEKKSEIEVFEELYEIQNNKKLSDSQKDFLNDLIKDISKEGK